MPIRRTCSRRSIVILASRSGELAFIAISFRFTSSRKAVLGDRERSDSLAGRELTLEDHRTAERTEAFDFDLANIARLHQRLRMTQSTCATVRLRHRLVPKETRLRLTKMPVPRSIGYAVNGFNANSGRFRHHRGFDSATNEPGKLAAAQSSPHCLILIMTTLI